MKVVNMKLSNGTGGLKAFFDLETTEGITIKGFKVADGKKGLFVGVPSEQDRNDKTKYWDRVVLSKDLKEEMTTQALHEFSSLGGS